MSGEIEEGKTTKNLAMSLLRFQIDICEKVCERKGCPSLRGYKKMLVAFGTADVDELELALVSKALLDHIDGEIFLFLREGNLKIMRVLKDWMSTPEFVELQVCMQESMKRRFQCRAER